MGMKKPGKDMPDLFMHYLKHGACIAATVVVGYAVYVGVGHFCIFVSGLVG